MAKVYTAANQSGVAYVIDGGGSGYQSLGASYTSAEAEYLAVMYGLGAYFYKFQKELDSRQDDIDVEKSKVSDAPEFYQVATPSQRTARRLPPPVLVCCSSESLVNQLSRQLPICNERLMKLAKQVWQMTDNVDVKYEWISIKENLAQKELR